MNFMVVLSSLSKLSILGAHNQIRQISTKFSPLHFQMTSALFGEPLKKRKKVDPVVIRQREERKRKKIEKRIRRLEKVSRQLKPIDELEVSLRLIDEKNVRTRKLPPPSVEKLESEALLEKEWARYKIKEHVRDTQTIDNIQFSQQRALNELKMVSEELYNEAVQTDSEFFPYEVKGPLFTPPIKNYDAPDGDYVDITKKFEGE